MKYPKTVFRYWWKSGKESKIMVGFAGNKKTPLINIKMQKEKTGLLFNKETGIDGSINIRQAKVLRDALTHILETMQPDKYGEGCPVFLNPRKKSDR